MSVTQSGHSPVTATVRPLTGIGAQRGSHG